MKDITYQFEGTSHGEGYWGTICGLPTGYPIDVNGINRALAVRKSGYGRSNRQFTEEDVVQLEGLNNGTTTDKMQFFVPNRKHSHKDNFTAVRSGHVDLVGSIKYGTTDLRSLNEVASGRNSLCYVVLGTVCKQILAHYGIQTYSYTQRIGNVVSNVEYSAECAGRQDFADLRCCDAKANVAMKQLVDKARQNGDSLGGVSVVVADGVPVGIGQPFPYNYRLDGIIAGAMMSIPAVKAVEIGYGKHYAGANGRDVADELAVNQQGDIVYVTNRCGGIVGGMSNGNRIVVYITVKPVPTVKGVQSVDIVTHQQTDAHYERADVTVVPTVGIIGDNMLAYVLLDTMMQEGKIRNLAVKEH